MTKLDKAYAGEKLQFDTLKKSEIKKLNKQGVGIVGEYYYEQKENEYGVVTATMFDNEYKNVTGQVVMLICLWDRRKSSVLSAETL